MWNSGGTSMTSLLSLDNGSAPAGGEVKTQASGALLGSVGNTTSVGRKRVLGTASTCCGCVVPRGGATSIAVAIILLIPSAVFVASVVPYGEVFSYVVVGVLTCASLFVLMLSVTLDPGILIPQPPNPALQPQIVTINHCQFECKVCPTCNIVRPPRSSHCAHCNWCVEEFDHHCGVLGSCVAKRTFRFFALFMVFSSALAAYVVVRSIAVLVQMDYSSSIKTDEGRWQLIAAFGCTIYGLIGGCCVGSQCAMYVYFGATNKTQKECHRPPAMISGEGNPFDSGICPNLMSRFFGPLGQSHITPGTPEYV